VVNGAKGEYEKELTVPILMTMQTQRLKQRELLPRLATF
jgi:hypothetical protein